jgi:3-mercaptopyruvate sulfurtransferase SseA
VQVLEGGIFEWANEGQPIEGPGGGTDKVRHGDSQFSGLLKRKHRAP